MTVIGEAEVEIRPKTSGFEKEAESKIGGTIKRLGALAAGAFVGAQAGSLVKSAVGEASDLQETVSKTRNVFGPASKAVEDWSKGAAKAFGLSQQAALGAVSQYGDMFVQLGFTQKQSAKTSEALVKTAADLGSFHNVDPSDVLERIGGALRGEYDSLQQLIPNISAARVEQEALRQTHKKSASDLTAAEKATATLAIIQRDGANAANDFAETSDGLANRQRVLSATFTDMKAKIGEQLLPVVVKLAGFAQDTLLPGLARLGGFLKETLGPAFTRLGEFIQDRVVPVVQSMARYFRETLLPAFQSVASFVVDRVVPGLQKALTPVLEGVRSLIEKVTTKIHDNRESFQKLWNGIKPVIAFLAERVAPVVGTVLGKAFSVLGDAIGIVIEVIAGLVDTFAKIKGWGDKVVGFFTGLPARIKRASVGMWDGLVGGLKGAINAIIDLWNKVDFKVSVHLPDWAGGKGWTSPDIFPDIPKLAMGGNVRRGQPVIVGDGGRPELFVPDQDGHVYPQVPAGVTVYQTNYQADAHEINRGLARELNLALAGF